MDEAWYENELKGVVDDANELAGQLQRVAKTHGADAAAEALGDVLPDVAGGLAASAGALTVLAREAPDAPGADDAARATARLLDHLAFLRSALEDRTETAQARRSEAEAQHRATLDAAARDRAREITVGLGTLRRGPAYDDELREAAHEAAEGLLEALPVLWVGRTIVVQRDEDATPDAVVEDAQRMLRFLGRWLAPERA